MVFCDNIKIPKLGTPKIEPGIKIKQVLVTQNGLFEFHTPIICVPMAILLLIIIILRYENTMVYKKISKVRYYGLANKG